jgi:hypothetical protein
MRYTITAPVENFTGEVAGVAFAHGTATVDTDRSGAANALGYFQRRGYTVAPVERPEPETPSEPESETPSEPESEKAAPKRTRRAGTKEEETNQ